MPGKIRFPDGAQIALTWSIPTSFGGLTTALFRRSRAFRTLGGVDVDVLTLDPQENRLERDLMMKNRDALVDGVKVDNLYDWLRENALPGGSLRLDREAFTPIELGEGTEERDYEDGNVRRIVRRNDSGDVMQIDHLRSDGSLVLMDRRDCRERGVTGGRSVILCDEAGTPVRSWRKIWHLYTAWLDRITAKKPTFLIVDSKVVARFAAGYQRDHITTVHVVHGSHIDDDGAQVRESRREVFAQLEDFGAVVFPTKGQRDDVRAIVGPLPNLVAIPNSLPNARAGNNVRAGSAMIARLESLKQVDHAMSAVQSANTSLESPITLDIYGDGPEKQSLEAAINNDPHIRLHGFVTDVQDRLMSSSTLLLTSRSEAFGLVIGEAMAAGCLPIAYDIKYGPSDFIVHGQNGWLVVPNDIEALANALREAAQLPEHQLAQMRVKALARAADFSQERVIDIWAEVLTNARRAAGETRLTAGSEVNREEMAEQPTKKIATWLRRVLNR